MLQIIYEVSNICCILGFCILYSKVVDGRLLVTHIRIHIFLRDISWSIRQKRVQVNSSRVLTSLYT